MILRPGSRGRAQLELVADPSGPAILKDFHRSPGWFRWTLGRIMAGREALAYRRLTGVRGIPRLLDRPAGDAVLLEYRKGVPLSRVPSRDLEPEFFVRLEELLESVRSRGVLHCDVANNVLRSSDGQPVLCDFGASFVIRGWMWPLRRFLVSLRARYDERVVAKLKKRYASRILTREEGALAETRLPFEDLIRPCERIVAFGVRLFR